MIYCHNISRRKFIQGLSCTCGAAMMLSSCAEVEISGRKQLNIFSDEYIHKKVFPSYQKFKNETKLITDTAEYKNLKEITFNIINSIDVYYANKNESNPTNNFQWEVVLVDDDNMKNAWCMPGGKMAFYSGILPIAKNKDGIASIMGHEIAHAVARHSAERASQALIMDLGTAAIEQFVIKSPMPSVSGRIRQFGIELPFSRNQESEADYLGLVFMSLSGYNTNESYLVWERMQQDSEMNRIPEFVSTHPAPKNRIKKLKEWIPIVINEYPPIKV